MGYNNNHAGMRWVPTRFTDYRYYNDDRDLDRAADKLRWERRQMEKMEERKRETPKNHDQEQACEEEKNYVLDFMKHVPNIGLIDQNAIFIGLKNNLDVPQIIAEAESIMETDDRTKPGSDIHDLMPYSISFMLFLSILADLMDCSIQDFFMDTSAERKKYVYKLIDHVSGYIINGTSMVYDDNDAEIELSQNILELEGGNTKEFISQFDVHPYSTMCDELKLTKIHNKKESWYSIEYNTGVCWGDIIHPTEIYDPKPQAYISTGVTLWSEKEGKLADCIESLIKKHPEWKD